MGFFDRISRGWQLTKASFRVLNQDKEILVLPVLSFLAMVTFLAFWFGIGVFTLGGLPGQTSETAWYVVLFLIYVSTAFVATFFLAATIEMAMIRLDGGDPVVKDGLRKAWAKKGKLLQWAIITATVGILLRVLRDRAQGLGRILVQGLELGWAIATYFAVPILVYRDVGPIDAIKGSVKEMRETWGEAATGVVSTGIIFLLLGLLGIVPIVLGIAIGSSIAVVIGIVVAVVYWIVLAAANGAVDGILRAALYRFAETGELPDGFQAAQPDAGA